MCNNIKINVVRTSIVVIFPNISLPTFVNWLSCILGIKKNKYMINYFVISIFLFIFVRVEFILNKIIYYTINFEEIDQL